MFVIVRIVGLEDWAVRNFFAHFSEGSVELPKFFACNLSSYAGGW